MGNSVIQTLPMQIYEAKLKSLNEQTTYSKKTDIIDLYATDILQVLISYCDRQEQYRLINIMFRNLQSSHRNILSKMLDKTIHIQPKIDPYLITSFNKKNQVLSAISSTMGYKFYFTNLHIKGTVDTIKYLKSNTDNIIYAFMYYASAMKKDMFKRDNTNHVLEIDTFIQSYKEKQYKDMEFNTADIFYSEDEKLENIKYKNSYKFDKFERINLNNARNIDNLSWKQYNDIFLKYLITNQLNFCCDDKKLYNSDINDDINLTKDDRFGLLCGCSLYCDPLIGYSLNSRISKHTQFLGATQYKTYKKSKKVFITTTKMSSVFLMNKISNEINVFTMLNRESEDHIKDKINYGKKILTAYVDSIHRSGF